MSNHLFGLDIKHWKCPSIGCPHIAKTRAYKHIKPDGSLCVHGHDERQCPAHEVRLQPCARDEFLARTAVH